MIKVADKIYEIVKNMPEKQAHEVLDFAEFLQQKSPDKVRQEEDLKPLPVFPGSVPPGWKGAIYPAILDWRLEIDESNTQPIH